MPESALAATTATTGPDKQITLLIGFLITLYASWEPHRDIAAILGRFLAYGLISLVLPYSIAKGLSKGKAFKGWLYLILTTLAGVIVIGAKVSSKS